MSHTGSRDPHHLWVAWAPVSQWCTCLLARLFQPVQYGQKPEGRTVAFPSTHPPRTAASATATANPQGHMRGRPPIATFSANPDTKGMPHVLVCPRGYRGSLQMELLMLPLPLWAGNRCFEQEQATCSGSAEHTSCSTPRSFWPFSFLKLDFFPNKTSQS